MTKALLFLGEYPSLLDCQQLKEKRKLKESESIIHQVKILNRFIELLLTKWKRPKIS